MTMHKVLHSRDVIDYESGIIASIEYGEDASIGGLDPKEQRTANYSGQ